MPRPNSFIRLFLLLIAAILLAVPAIRADPHDGDPKQPRWFAWDRAELDVLVVPPHHGPLGVTIVTDPNANILEPTNLTHYWSAVDAIIGDWHAARKIFVIENPQHAWLSNVTVNYKMFYSDPILPADIARADIIMGNVETMDGILGVAVHPFHATPIAKTLVGDKCLLFTSLEYVTRNVSWSDYYNIGAHEFGHCLGLDHSSLQHDTMYGSYSHTIGADNALHCMSNLNLLGLTLSFGDVLGHPTNATEVTMPIDDYRTYPLRPNCETGFY